MDWVTAKDENVACECVACCPTNAPRGVPKSRFDRPVSRDEEIAREVGRLLDSAHTAALVEGTDGEYDEAIRNATRECDYVFPECPTPTRSQRMLANGDYNQ